MDGRLEIGFVAGTDPARVAAMEALPIDSLWMGGHLASPNPSPEALVALAQLATVTRRVRVGTSILLLPLYPPAIVAKMVADVDRASGGRVVLGVGVGGEYPAEFRAARVPIGERGARTDEAIPLLRRLWTADEIMHDGRYYAMENVRIHPAPTQAGGPPIVVAGRQPAAMRRAARLGDGWMPYLYSPRRYAESVATIRAIADDAGRDLTSFDWYAFVFVNVDDDADRARADAAQSLGANYRQDFAEMIDHVAVAGTVDDVTRRLDAFVAAGARHFIVAPATGARDPDVAIHRLLDEVIPRVREHAALG
jgi:probable F420-dependent oxidoreductase